MSNIERTPDPTPAIKIAPDGSYDLRGATGREVLAALDDHAFKHDPGLRDLPAEEKERVKARWAKTDALLERFPFLEKILKLFY